MPPWLAPVALAVLLLVALLAVVALAREAGKTDVPPEPGAFQKPPPPGYAAFDVQQVQGGTLTLTSGTGAAATTSSVSVGANDRVWFLQQAAISDVKPPMVVNVIAIPNEVRNYTIHLLAFGPVPTAVNFEGPFIPLADGFGGYETSRDTTERAVVSAVLESFDGRNGVTRSASGAGTLYLDPGAPVRMIEAGSLADIHPGDRIAFHTGADGQPDPAQGVLVLPGGAEAK